MLTLLTKVYSEDSLRYRINESIHKGNYLFGKTLKNKVQRLKDEAFIEKENFIIYFQPFGNNNGPLFYNNKFPEVRTATHEDEANGYAVKGSECFDAEYQPSGEAKNVMRAWPIKDKSRYIVYMSVDKYDVYYYVYIGSAGGWFDVSEYYDKVGLKGGGVWVDNLPKNIKKIRPYKFWKSVLNVQQKVTRFFYRCLHTIDSCYLCIRFPFLYPRNRFTDRHYNNWKLSNYEKKLYSEAVFSPYIKYPKDETTIPVFDISKNNFPIVQRRDFKPEYNMRLEAPYDKECYITDEKGNEIILFSPKSKNEGKLVRFVYAHDEELGDIYREATYSPKLGWVFFDEYREAPDYQPLEFEHDDYVSKHMSFLISPEKYWKRNFIAWFHKNILGAIFFIPTTSEIDAMETGWFRAFGMDFLKELKAQLKKEGRLYKYRIAQIKEKWGRFTWYDAASSDEVFNLIEKYSEMSSKICIDCGRPADYITTGYILPLCEKHISEEGKLSAHDLRKPESEEESEENKEAESN